MIKVRLKLRNVVAIATCLAGVTMFSGCGKDNNENGNGESVSMNTISAKWEISDSNSPYASFEFNKDGNYIVVENVGGTNLKSLITSSKASLFKTNSLKAASTRSSESESNLSPIHFGTYRIEGDKIILSGFGLIEVISITAEEFLFSFTLEATSEKNSFVANKSAEPISSSSRTDMFCRTWIVQESIITENGVRQSDIEDESNGIIVLFSKAGTYLCIYSWEEEAGLAEWKWADKEETKWYYSWDNWKYDCEYCIATITELSNNTMVIQGGSDGFEYKYYMTLKN